MLLLILSPRVGDEPRLVFCLCNDVDRDRDRVDLTLLLLLSTFIRSNEWGSEGNVFIGEWERRVLLVCDNVVFTFVVVDDVVGGGDSMTDPRICNTCNTIDCESEMGDSASSNARISRYNSVMTN